MEDGYEPAPPLTFNDVRLGQNFVSAHEASQSFGKRYTRIALQCVGSFANAIGFDGERTVFSTNWPVVDIRGPVPLDESYVRQLGELSPELRAKLLNGKFD